MREDISFVRKLFHDQPQEVDGTAEAVARICLESTDFGFSQVSTCICPPP
jgi:hypothetical protein